MDPDAPQLGTSRDASERAADSVVFAIQTDIQTGALEDGDTLATERDLMRRFDVSRTVVREAIGILTSRGLIENRPRYRPVVRRPSMDSALGAVEGIVLHLLTEPGGVKNLFETRILIEAGLVREMAMKAHKEDISALKSALDLNQAAISDSEAFYKTDIGFHQVLYQVNQNPVLPAIHKAYKTWLAPQWMLMPRLPERNEINFRAHNAIFQAILMRDPDAAEAALRSHMNSAWEQVRQTFGEI